MYNQPSACLIINVCHPADEVESLAAARKAALSGSEPSDSIRVKSHSPPPHGNKKKHSSSPFGTRYIFL